MICHSRTIRLANEDDVETVRWVLNDPSVRVTFGDLTVDRETWLDSFEKLPVFLFPGGFIAAEVRTNWSVFIHVAALPKSRGRILNDAMTELVAWLFVNTPCTSINGWIRYENRAAQMWCSMMGAKKRATHGDRILYRLTRAEYEGKAA